LTRSWSSKVGVATSAYLTPTAWVVPAPPHRAAAGTTQAVGVRYADVATPTLLDQLRVKVPPTANSGANQITSKTC